ncbi:MAG: endonuclease III [Chloroflexota bacterium]|nr:endonuclease III [Chloroflexota bacterium]
MDQMLSGKAMAIYALLLEHYGAHELKARREPMHELISTILSQRTTNQNEAIACRQMWEQFGSWESIRDAPVAALTEAIAPSNYPEVKAPHIQATLHKIIDARGEATIDFLRDLPLHEAMDWLMDLPGVGVKTASLVMLFCFAKPILPVDTHVHRVSQRTGLIGAKVTPDIAHAKLLDLLPNDPYILYNFHVSALKHGQQLCTWSNPKCAPCPLNGLCDYFQALKGKPAS